MITSEQVELLEYNPALAFTQAKEQAYNNGKYQYDFTLTLQSVSMVVDTEYYQEMDDEPTKQVKTMWIYTFQVVYG